MTDPFASVQNATPKSDHEWRQTLLATARRGYAPVRKVFVQRPREESTRSSVLGALVQTRQELAIRLYLLVLALEPMVDLALPPRRWAGMISSAVKSCSAAQFQRALQHLTEGSLVTAHREGNLLRIRPLLEDGSGEPYERPTAKGAAIGKGFFVVPHEYWDTGLADRLRLPGTAMLMVCLHDTSQAPSFQVALEHMGNWYGISERTAERGYRELMEAQILLTRPQSILDPRSPTGTRFVTWRALAEPYSRDARVALQSKARAAVKARGNQP